MHAQSLVKLSWDGNKINIKPGIVALHTGAELIWEITAANNETVEIEFPKTEYPFFTADSFKQQGPGDISSGPTFREVKGEYKYKVTWKVKGKKVAEEDPWIMFR